jgi:hypothetical protein
VGRVGHRNEIGFHFGGIVAVGHGKSNVSAREHRMRTRSYIRANFGVLRSDELFCPHITWFVDAPGERS